MSWRLSKAGRQDPSRSISLTAPGPLFERKDPCGDSCARRTSLSPARQASFARVVHAQPARRKTKRQQIKAVSLSCDPGFKNRFGRRELPDASFPSALKWKAVKQHDCGDTSGAQHVAPIAGNNRNDETHQADRAPNRSDLDGGSL